MVLLPFPFGGQYFLGSPKSRTVPVERIVRSVARHLKVDMLKLLQLYYITLKYSLMNTFNFKVPSFQLPIFENYMSPALQKLPSL